MDARSTSDPDPAAANARIADAALVRGHLVAAARAGLALSYSELLNLLGLRFTRPRMRALCRTLDRIDAEGAAAGEPALAVLAVREGDGLPGQGWWVGRHDWTGAWVGDAAVGYVRRAQRVAFAYWQARAASANGLPDQRSGG